VKQFSDKVVVIGKVNHSQRMNDKPLTPWIIAMKEGKILACHCDCMAGFGETCSHVACLLWVIASGVQHRDAKTVTDKSAYWVMPAGVNCVPYAEIKDISFTGKKRKKHDCLQDMASTEDSDDASIKKPKKNQIHNATEEDKKSFLTKLASLSSKPAVLAVVPEFCDVYVPSSIAPDLHIRYL
jgi:hypothetical protein